jgi:hypothetical protein
MKIQTSKGLLELSQELFWDVDLKRASSLVEYNPHWVLPRIFEYGSLDEIADIIHYYGEEASKKILIEQKDELKPMTKAMAHVFLNIELRDYCAVEREF